MSCVKESQDGYNEFRAKKRAVSIRGVLERENQSLNWDAGRRTNDGKRSTKKKKVISLPLKPQATTEGITAEREERQE